MREAGTALTIRNFGGSDAGHGALVGKGRAGDVGRLAELGRGLGFEVEVVPAVEVALADHLTVRASSSIVRWLLLRGRVRDAGLVLGRPYELVGTVVKGDQVGRRLG